MPESNAHIEKKIWHFGKSRRITSPALVLYNGEKSFQDALCLGRKAEAFAGSLPEGCDCLLNVLRQLSAECHLVWRAGLLVNGGLRHRVKGAIDWTRCNLPPI